MDWRKIIPQNLYTDEPNSLYQKWLETLKVLSDLSHSQADLEKARYTFSTMDLEQAYWWESILLIPHNDTLTLQERIAQILVFIAGTQGVTLDIKSIVSQAFGIDMSLITIIPRNTILLADPVWNFTYDVQIDPSVGVIDLDLVRAVIEKTHAAHCRLGRPVVYSDFWEWDNAAKPLDDVEFVTNFSVPTLSGSLLTDMQATTLTDGNQYIIDLFINSVVPEYGFYAREQATPNMTVQLAPYANILVGSKFYNYAGGNSPTFTAPVSGTETHLLYAYDNAGTLAFDIANTGFTAGDPSTYGVVSTAYPIAEVTLTDATTAITDSLIKDVLPFYTAEAIPRVYYGYVFGGYTSGSVRDNDEYAQISNSWTAKTDLPIPARAYLSTVSIGLYAYCFGGVGVGGVSADNDEYSKIDNSWASKTDMPSPARQGQKSALIGLYAYCFGGYQLNYLSDNDEYAQVGNSWANKTDLPSPIRAFHSSAAIDLYAYCFGGGSTSSAILSDNDEYAQVGNSWANKTDLPSPVRYQHSSSSIRSYAYCFGGATPTTIADNDEYSQAGNSWSAKTNLPSPARYNNTSSSIDLYVYCFGGVSTSNILDNDEYSQAGNSWSAKADMPSPARAQSASVSM